MKPILSAALQAAVLCLCALYGHPAWAYGNCKLWQEGGYPYNLVYNLPPTIVLPADRHDWTQDSEGAGSSNILAHARIEPASDSRFPTYPSDPAYKPYIFCDGAASSTVTREILLEGLGPPIPGSSPPIYPTGVTGVGIQARMGVYSNWLPYITDEPYVSGGVAGIPAFYWSVQWFRIELVATAKTPHQGDIDLGITRPATVTLTYKQSGGPDLRVLNLTIPSIRVIRGSCTVPDTNVPMGRIPLSAFDASDAPAQAGRAFQVNLNCSGAMKMTYSVYSGNRENEAQGIIGLDATPISARNVGLQIQDENGTPLALGITQPANGQPLITDAGLFPLKFRAQYRRLQPGAISPGLANATATITMQYR